MSFRRGTLALCLALAVIALALCVDATDASRRHRSHRKAHAHGRKQQGMCSCSTDRIVKKVPENGRVQLNNWVAATTFVLNYKLAKRNNDVPSHYVAPHPDRNSKWNASQDITAAANAALSPAGAPLAPGLTPAWASFLGMVDEPANPSPKSICDVLNTNGPIITGAGGNGGPQANAPWSKVGVIVGLWDTESRGCVDPAKVNVMFAGLADGQTRAVPFAEFTANLEAWKSATRGMFGANAPSFSLLKFSEPLGSGPASATNAAPAAAAPNAAAPTAPNANANKNDGVIGRNPR